MTMKLKRSKEQKDIRIRIANSNNAEIILELKTKRNRMLKEIKEKHKITRDKEIDSITNEIVNALHDHQFYKAIKLLRNPNTKNENIVYDKEGKTVTNKERQYEIVKQHFKSHFYDS